MPCPAHWWIHIASGAGVGLWRSVAITSGGRRRGLSRIGADRPGDAARQLVSAMAACNLAPVRDNPDCPQGPVGAAGLHHPDGQFGPARGRLETCCRRAPAMSLLPLAGAIALLESLASELILASVRDLAASLPGISCAGAGRVGADATLALRGSSSTLVFVAVTIGPRGR